MQYNMIVIIIMIFI